MYVNSSVNGAGDQVLWYNYSVWTGPHHYHGTYDDLVFNATTPVEGPAQFLASPVPGPEVEVDESYEFDAFIGADDGSNQLVLGANATEQLKYCSISSSPTGTGCTPKDHTYANVPAAVNYGTQTGEETVGVAVNYVGATAYLSAGPLIEHGLWNYTGETGVAPGNTKVVNHITVSGSPRPDHPTAVRLRLFQQHRVQLRGLRVGGGRTGLVPDARDLRLRPHAIGLPGADRFDHRR